MPEESPPQSESSENLLSIGSENAAEFAALHRAIDAASGGFALIVAECASPELSAKISHAIATRVLGLRVLRVRPEMGDILHFVSATAETPGCSGVIVLGFEELAVAGSTPERAWRVLNASRDLWPSQVRCPVVLWLPPYLVQQFISEAPDFWSFRAQWLRFEASDGLVSSPSLMHMDGALTLPAGNLPEVVKSERIRLLVAQARLMMDEHHPDLERAGAFLTEAGMLALVKGDLTAAEENFKVALELAEKTERLESVADICGNLSIIARIRGNLSDAEDLLKKTLAIDQKVNDQAGMARVYGNLANIEMTRGDLERAEMYINKSLAIEQQRGHVEGIASDYGTLGVIEMIRGRLDSAEQYMKKALAMEEVIGHLDGVAAAYGNLGLIERTKGNLVSAELYTRKAAMINERLGNQEGLASAYGNLGIIERMRGNLDIAVHHMNKSLDINLRLGRTEGVAIQYANLGSIAAQRSDLVEARRMLHLSLDLYQKVGSGAMEAKLRSWLDALPEPPAETPPEKK